MSGQRRAPFALCLAVAFLLVAAPPVGAITYDPAILLAPPTAEFSVDLGNAVAISGDRVIVGDSQSRRFFPTSIGAAYLFDLSGNLLLTFKGPAIADNFGKSVAIDGTRVVIGDNLDDLVAGDHGRAYLFDIATCDATDTVPGDGICDVPALQFRNPTLVPGGGPQFGFSVGIDGDLVVIGTPQTGAGGVAFGAAYVFDIASCDADDDRVCDGPAATLLNPTPEPQPVGDREFFGRAVAISGTTVLVGARFDDAGGNRNGAAYLFHLEPCDVNRLCALATAMFPNPVPETESEFGHSVALRGNVAVVGAPGATVGRPDGTVALHGGKAYVYDLAACAAGICAPMRELWSPTAFDGDRFGDDVAVSGRRALVGAPFANLGSTDAGAVYLYDLESCGAGTSVCDDAEHTFANPGPITTGLGQAFGEAIALDGTTVVIGARQNDHGGGNRGSAHLFLAGNTAPVAGDDSYGTVEETALAVPAPGVLGNDGDDDGNPLTASLVSGPAHGTLTLNADGSFTYTPNADFNGTDSFTYRAHDGTADSGLATVTITVSATNDAPVALNDQFGTAEDTPLTVAGSGVLGNDTDADGNPLVAVLVTGPANGTLALNANGSFTYTPNANFNGTDSFTYRASDGTASSGDATATIAVSAVNDPPTAANDAYTTQQNAALTVAAPGVLGNDADVDGMSLTAVLVSGPAHGTLALNADGSFTYTPEPGFSGSDSFTYRASDGAAASAPATVALTVTAAPQQVPGAMIGVGQITSGGQVHMFAFTVLERSGLERGRLFYATAPERRRGDGPRQRFVTTEIMRVDFSDTPGVRPARGGGPAVDTAAFSGFGVWNGQPGFAFEARAMDAGEPGRGRDEFSLTIRAPGGAVVATVSGRLSAGNIESRRLQR